MGGRKHTRRASVLSVYGNTVQRGNESMRKLPCFSSRSTISGAAIVFFLFPIFIQTTHAQVANFSASPRKGYPPLVVNFTDLSSGPISAKNWYFPGGTPSSKTGDGPHQIVYNTPGKYDVTLIVFGPIFISPPPSDTLTKGNHIRVWEPTDWGDAPDDPEDTTKSYPTLQAHDGASHIINNSIYLGDCVDPELDGQPTLLADGDDADEQDEDGIILQNTLIGDMAVVRVSAHGDGFLNAWFDLNRDGDWDEEDEHVFQNLSLTDGEHTISAAIPQTARAGTTYARFRYSTEEDLPYTGPAANGEVEDHIFNLFNDSFYGDSLALVALYNATDGPNWFDHTNWLTGPLHTWTGITTMGTGLNRRVIGIDLCDNNLNGTLPAELGNLKKLKTFWLENGNITRPIPPEIGDLEDLETLVFFELPLSCPIPPEIGNWTHIEYLTLASCSLSGPIPPEIGNCLSLRHVHFFDNALSNPIPVEIANLNTLEILDLSQNQFAGAVPSQIFSMTNLISLQLYDNQFTGTIPDFSTLVNLETLLLGHNDFTGSIPLTLFTLPSLQLLDLGYNELTGPVPPQINNLVNLEQFQFSGNNLDGTLPVEIFSMNPLSVVLLSDNQFTGQIPNVIGNLVNLTEINLSNNGFSGEVPLQITNCTNLGNMVINNNQFTGLPDLSSMPSLLYLFMHNNRLTFEDLEPNLCFSQVVYAPQDSVGSGLDTTVVTGCPLQLSVSVGGSANIYQWIKDGSDISGANSDSYGMDPVDISDTGKYLCRITNTIATACTLWSRTMRVNVTTGISEQPLSPEIPEAFNLYPNYPNPFNSVTMIRYDLPEPSHVQLIIYDLRGQEVDVLVDERKKEGVYRAEWIAGSLPSGIYFIHLKTEKYMETRKLIVQK